MKLLIKKLSLKLKKLVFFADNLLLYKYKLKDINMIKIKTITQAICYLLFKIGKPTDKMKVIKLLFLADKYHLLHYGRTITEDDFVAMQHGPVGSTSLNILNYDRQEEYFSKEAIKYIQSHISIINNVKRAVADNPLDYNMLSETDKASIDIILNKFGHMKTYELREYTHQYPEWKQYEDDFNKHITEQERLSVKELFSFIDDKLDVDSKLLQSSKQIFDCTYE